MHPRLNVEGETYTSLQPRLSARMLMAADWSLKASYADMRQFIHLLTNSGVGLPTDLWVPATAKVKPQGSRQWALGAARISISLSGWQLSESLKLSES